MTSAQIMLNMTEDFMAEMTRLRSMESLILKRKDWLEDKELKAIVDLKLERFKRLESR